MADLVVGVDAGGTATRCVLAAADGTVLGRGESGGANQHSSGGDIAARLAEAVRTALGGHDPARVNAGVFGISGAGGAGHATAQGMSETAWRSLGLPGRPTVVTDIAIAFAAGTPRHEGAVLIAGTGAVAAAVADTRIVRRCDGYGWLLGDEGSAVWLGREAVRSVLAAADGRGEATALSFEVSRTLVGDTELAGSVLTGERTPDALAQALIATVYEHSPAQLGRLAPVVNRVADAGDAVARELCRRAAQRLLAAVDAVSPSTPTGSPVVLSGSVLSGGTVAETVRAGLAERDIVPLTAGDGVLGATALALRHLDPDPEHATAAYERLRTTLS